MTARARTTMALPLQWAVCPRCDRATHILAGTLQTSRCAHCGAAFTIQGSTLWHAGQALVSGAVVALVMLALMWAFGGAGVLR